MINCILVIIAKNNSIQKKCHQHLWIYDHGESNLISQTCLDPVKYGRMINRTLSKAKHSIKMKLLRGKWNISSKRKMMSRFKLLKSRVCFLTNGACYKITKAFWLHGIISFLNENISNMLEIPFYNYFRCEIVLSYKTDTCFFKILSSRSWRVLWWELALSSKETTNQSA